MIRPSHLTDSQMVNFVRGEVDLDSAEQWLDHLDQCDQCSQRYDDFSSAVTRLIASRVNRAIAAENPFRDEPGFATLTQAIDQKLSVQQDRQRALDQKAPAVVGPYRIGEVIGYGGMGVVYEASHRWLGKKLAIKLLRADLEIDANRLHQFTREFEAVGRLDHPAIVRAIDAGVSGGHAFLAMDHIEGQDLEKVRRANGKFRPADVIEIGIQIASGLHHAHQRGVIHRDVKPSNIMLARSEHHHDAEFGFLIWDWDKSKRQ